MVTCLIGKDTLLFLLFREGAIVRWVGCFDQLDTPVIIRCLLHL